MNLTKALTEELLEFDRIVSQAERQLADLPEGTIRVSVCRGHVQYYMQTAEDLGNKRYNGHYISRKNRDMIPMLCCRRYWEKVYTAAKKQKDILHKFVSDYNEDAVKEIYLSMPEEITKHVQPLTLPDDEYVKWWLSEEYEKKPFAEGTSEIYSDRGERVRSKSEKIIADMLANTGIPYKYEKPLILQGGRMIHPDFTLLSIPQRREYYLEHFGMMDDSQYASNAVQRILDYEKSGIFPGQKLLLSYETSRKSLDVRLLQKVIQSILTE